MFCVNAGAIFNRKALISIGGQSFGSITEDFFTAMELLASGFTSLFVEERLVHGMAPTTISAVFAQRYRWALGSLQILTLDNPLFKAGLTVPQSLLFFEASTYHFMAYPYALFAISPIVYLYSGFAPILVSRLWEFVIFFGCMYFTNRIAMLVLYRGCLGATLELWRGSQLSIWLIYNNIRATLKYALWAMLRWFKVVSSIYSWLAIDSSIMVSILQVYTSIQFRVTRKSRDDEGFWVNFLCVWPYIGYILAYIGGLVHFIVFAAKGTFNAAECVVYISVSGWGLVMVFYMWPPIETLLPRRETDEGWRIAWDPFYNSETFEVDQNHRLVRKLSRIFSKQRSDTMSNSKGVKHKQTSDVTAQNAMQVAVESLSKVHASFNPHFENEEEDLFELSPFAMMEHPEEEYDKEVDALESQSTRSKSGGKKLEKSTKEPFSFPFLHSSTVSFMIFAYCKYKTLIKVSFNDCAARKPDKLQ